MSKPTKDKIKLLFYTLAIIGMSDMIVYSASQGEVKLIHTVLGIIFN